jgi:mRNA interferase MazF
VSALVRGDIVLAPFSYSDLRGMKRRPACVVSADAYHAGPDVILVMVTSQAARRQAPGLGDVVIAGWQAAGLLAPSTVRAGRLLVLEQSRLGSTLGRLSAPELAAVDDALRVVLALS